MYRHLILGPETASTSFSSRHRLSAFVCFDLFGWRLSCRLFTLVAINLGSFPFLACCATFRKILLRINSQCSITHILFLWWLKVILKILEMHRISGPI
jgi:hypothetical protein